MALVARKPFLGDVVEGLSTPFNLQHLSTNRNHPRIRRFWTSTSINRINSLPGESRQRSIPHWFGGPSRVLRPRCTPGLTMKAVALSNCHRIFLGWTFMGSYLSANILIAFWLPNNFPLGSFSYRRNPSNRKFHAKCAKLELQDVMRASWVEAAKAIRLQGLHMKSYLAGRFK